MKRICLHLLSHFCFSVMVALVGCAFLGISATTVTAQANASVAPAPPISIEDFPQESDWKSPVDYAAVIASERATAALKLSGPNVKEPTLALYTGYDRMLSNMQQDLIISLPIEEIATKNYHKVVAEAPADPILSNLESAEFDALYTALLVLLHQ